MVLLGMIAVGCAPKEGGAGPGAELTGGYRALESKQFDQAMATADAYLIRTPAGPGSAEALYLRGRALSERPAGSPMESQSNLTGARQAYNDALRLHPPQPLEAYIRTSLANAAYFQDDFAVAAEQWAIAYDQLQPEDLRAWVLYKLGRAQQRMGRFESADRTFTQVRQAFAGTQQDGLAKEAAGARQFVVQLATFSSEAGARRAADAVRKMGVAAMIEGNANRQSVLRVGPVGTYEQAKGLAARFAGDYPDAIIIP